MSQEEGLRSASKKIDVMMKQFEENYAVRDKQDV
jgi:cell division protein ZapA